MKVATWLLVGFALGWCSALLVVYLVHGVTVL
jgi:hypothetical protein